MKDQKEPCEFCRGCAEQDKYDNRKEKQKFPYIEAFRSYMEIRPGTNYIKKDDMDVWYCPHCGRKLQGPWD